MAVIRYAAFVFLGGAIGAVAREFFMLLVPTLSDGFPLDILAANIAASMLLGIHKALHTRKVVSEGALLFAGTGIAGGLSTFSSFAYASAVLMTTSTASALVAAAYVLISLLLGYAAVRVGLMLGRMDSRYL